MIVRVHSCGKMGGSQVLSLALLPSFAIPAQVKMLLSTRIVYQFATRTALAREWRVVMVPDDECSTVNFIDLYLKIVNHTLDPLEPFVLPEDKNNSPIRVRIGKSKRSWLPRCPFDCQSVWSCTSIRIVRNVFCAMWRSSCLIALCDRYYKERISGIFFDMQCQTVTGFREWHFTVGSDVLKRQVAPTTSPIRLFSHQK